MKSSHGDHCHFGSLAPRFPSGEDERVVGRHHQDQEEEEEKEREGRSEGYPRPTHAGMRTGGEPPPLPALPKPKSERTRPPKLRASYPKTRWHRDLAYHPDAEDVIFD